MLQQQEADDFVIATGVQFSVRQFVERATAELGITVAFEGAGEREVARVVSVAAIEGEHRARCRPGDVIVRVDPAYYRPTEVETLLGDATKARLKLDWTPRTSFATLVKEMIAADYEAARRDSMIRDAGFRSYNRHE